MQMKPTQTLQTDYLIIGAGLIGSAVAMGLARLGVDRVTVVDLDLAGEWSSSELNAGGVRATWSQEVNLLTSKFSIEYYEKNAELVGYRDCGYLWLHRQATWENALKAREMHVAKGWQVDVLDPRQIQNQVPFIDKTSDLVGGLFGVKDGLVNPNRLKEHYREEAAQAGVKFLDGVWIETADLKTESNLHRLHAFQFNESLTSEQKKICLTEVTQKNPLSEAQGQSLIIEAKNVVNCGGAWAPALAKILGYVCPSVPVRRQISLFHARDLDLTPYGMIIDPSGVYFHPEAIYGLSGFANADEAPGFNFQYDGESFFQEHIWPALYERSTAFESLRHVSGWAGLYESSPDHHAIVGAVKGLSGIYEAHSFSGHGAMQSYGVVISLAELMVKQAYHTLDLSELSGDRFQSGRKLSDELWVI